MAKIGVIDWSYVCLRIWQSLPTRKIPWTRPTEAEEGIHRICEWVYALYLEHGWDRLIIAKDTPGYWRHEYIADWHLRIPRYVHADGHYYTLYNGLLHRITKEAREEDMGGFDAKLNKLTAPEEKKLLPGLVLLDSWPEEMPEPSWPRYKGNRKDKADSWQCETSLEQFYSIRDRAAERIGLLVKGKTVSVKGAEADDIAAVVASMSRHQVVLMSGDGDWAQLLRQGSHVRFHNLYNNARVEYHEGIAEEIKTELLVKIIGGDAGDNVKGVPRKDRKGRSCLAKDGVKKLMDTMPLGEIVPLLDPLYVTKNRAMMHLSQKEIPPYIWAGILEAMRAPEKIYSAEPMTWDQLGLTSKERERMEVAGGAARIFTQWQANPQAVVDAL